MKIYLEIEDKGYYSDRPTYAAMYINVSEARRLAEQSRLFVRDATKGATDEQ